eukprot:TRINITY_DN4874_c0_g1_i1.p1 TRINITY_DN4874_c0_g1~~TRINITY_DN4874_c0_g1_i1.p1  ORF type:complete len:483 (+),score=55.36 TRINITY_DN4874_c0_g1_i1:114-1562(+)
MVVESPCFTWTEHPKSILSRGHLGEENEHERNERQRLKWRAFAVVYFAYTTYHFTRNNISAAKMGLKSDAGMTLSQLGNVDTSYLTMYAMGQFGAGALADHWGPRATMLVGMVGSALCSLIIGMSSDPTLPLQILWALNGLFQATGWASSIQVLSNWFPESERAFAVGLWCTNSSLGSVSTAFLAGTLISYFAWRGAFTVTAVLVLLSATAVYFLLINCPEDVGMRAPSESLPFRVDEESPLLGTTPRHKPNYLALLTPDTTPLLTDCTVDSIMSIMNGEKEAPLVAVMREPRVWLMGMGYFFVKLVRYSLWFWLPMYLHSEQGYSVETATYAGSAFDIGGVVGLMIIGRVCDKYLPHRAQAASLGLLALAFALLIFPTLAGGTPVACLLGLAFIGMTLYAPDCIVAGAAAQDIGGPDGTASAAGIINGLGSIGACFQGFVVSTVVTHYSWNTLFYVFSGGILFSVFILLPVTIKPWVVRDS